jgi:hypothetical protein
MYYEVIMAASKPNNKARSLEIVPLTRISNQTLYLIIEHKIQEN